jgi:hypothetical protein
MRAVPKNFTLDIPSRAAGSVNPSSMRRRRIAYSPLSLH